MSDNGKDGSNDRVDVFIRYRDIDTGETVRMKWSEELVQRWRNRVAHEIAHHGTSPRPRKTPFSRLWEPAAFAAYICIAGFASIFIHWNARTVHRPPGARLDAFASFFFSKRTYETVLKPYLAEVQEEYFEALKEGWLRKARWVRVRGVVGFWSHVVFQMPVSATRLAKRLWTISGG